MGIVNLFCECTFNPIIQKFEIKKGNSEKKSSEKNSSDKKNAKKNLAEKITEKDIVEVDAAVTVLSSGILEILDQITLVIGNSVNSSPSDRTHVAGIMSALFKIPRKNSEHFFKVIQSHIEQAYAIGSEVLPGYLVPTLT